jgi:hypothetical protein
MVLNQRAERTDAPEGAKRSFSVAATLRRVATVNEIRDQEPNLLTELVTQLA